MPARAKMERTPPARPDERGLAARLAAARIVRGVVGQRQPLDGLLDQALSRIESSRDRALARNIASTALRRRGQIVDVLAGMMREPPTPGSPLEAVLHVGAVQILFLDVPDHSAVDVAVACAAIDTKTVGAKNLVNAVLRRLSREGDALIAVQDAARLDTPDWLWERWTRTYGDEAAHRIASAHLTEPALDLSVKRDALAWSGRLGGTALNARTVRIARGGPVEDVEGFAEGAWWVQDAAAALPAAMLGVLAGKRVLDMCAAPGGKTAQLASAGARVTALDRSRSRLTRLAANLQRLALEADIVVSDALAYEPNALFDAILLDAPCTATGTIRRHPDVAWTKTPGDLAALVDLQGRLLSRAADWVRPGGALVYCTCSLEPEEGEERVRSFLAERTDWTLAPLDDATALGAPAQAARDGMLRTLPSMTFSDAGELGQGLAGFFAARLDRAA